MECSERRNVLLVCTLLILCCCLMFVIGLLFGCRWLSCCKITVNHFLFILTIPPTILVFWVKIRKPDIKRKLNHNQAKSAKYVLEIVSGPYRMKENRSRGEPQTGMVWDCIYLLRCFLLSLACVLLNKSIDRLVVVCFILVLFRFLHLHVKPFKMARANQMEVLSSLSLLLMTSLCFIMNSHVESTIIEIAMDMLVLLSFAPTIVYIAFILYDVCLIFVFDYIGNLF